MTRLLRITSGSLLVLIGLGSGYFGITLLLTQLSWLMIGGFLVFAGFGFGFMKLGIAMILGRRAKESIWFMLTIGRRGP